MVKDLLKINLIKDKKEIDLISENKENFVYPVQFVDYKSELADCLKNIGDIYLKMNENDNALGYYNRALAIYYEIDDRHDIEKLLPKIEQAKSISKTPISSNEMQDITQFMRDYGIFDRRGEMPSGMKEEFQRRRKLQMEFGL